MYGWSKTFGLKWKKVIPGMWNETYNSRSKILLGTNQPTCDDLTLVPEIGVPGADVPTILTLAEAPGEDSWKKVEFKMFSCFCVKLRIPNHPLQSQLHRHQNQLTLLEVEVSLFVLHLCGLTF